MTKSEMDNLKVGDLFRWNYSDYGSSALVVVSAVSNQIGEKRFDLLNIVDFDETEDSGRLFENITISERDEKPIC